MHLKRNKISFKPRLSIKSISGNNKKSSRKKVLKKITSIGIPSKKTRKSTTKIKSKFPSTVIPPKKRSYVKYKEIIKKYKSSTPLRKLFIFRCITLSRSGSYAIFYWLSRQFFRRRENKVEENNYIHILGKKKDIIFERYADIGIPFEARNSFKSKKEGYLNIPNFQERESTYIIIMRDPFNLFASRCKKRYSRREVSDGLDILREMWKSHAREFLNDTNYLSEKIGISYNQWFKDVSYRKQICYQLNGHYTERGINRMTEQGGGSSFERKSKKLWKNAQSLDTMNRWKVFEKNTKNYYVKKYMSLFQDQELVSLSNRIFGEIKGTEFLTGKCI